MSAGDLINANCLWHICITPGFNIVKDKYQRIYLHAVPSCERIKTKTRCFYLGKYSCVCSSEKRIKVDPSQKMFFVPAEVNGIISKSNRIIESQSDHSSIKRVDIINRGDQVIPEFGGLVDPAAGSKKKDEKT